MVPGLEFIKTTGYFATKGGSTLCYIKCLVRIHSLEDSFDEDEVAKKTIVYDNI